MLQALRTPGHRFESLPDYTFDPHYVEDLPGYEGIRGHYVDEGDPNAEEVFLCLHGEPSWSYIYRKMIPVFVGSGARVIAPDWLGFGKSDKPVDDDAYSFHWHRDYMLGLFKHLDLKNITLVVQDWGGVLGLTLPQEMPDRFNRLIIMNTGLRAGPVNMPAFDEWQADIDSDPDVPIEMIMRKNEPSITKTTASAYAAPFPDQTYKAGVRKFPHLIAKSMDAPGVVASQKAAEFWSTQWTGESFMAIGMKDKMLGPGVMNHLRTFISGCPEPLEIAEEGTLCKKLPGPSLRVKLYSTLIWRKGETMKNPHEIIDFLEAWQAAWSRQDIDSILAFFDDTFQFEDIPIGLHATNKAEMRAVFLVNDIL